MSANLFTYTAIECPVMTVSEYQLQSSDSHSAGDVITYWCEASYGFSSNSAVYLSSECLYNGQWTNPIPECRSKIIIVKSIIVNVSISK